jgi:16S rRNA (cytosine1402-N4)-methyltransferase
MHIPVLLKEVIDFVKPQPNENFIDATVGEGGYTICLLQHTSPNGKVLGIDLDSESLKIAERKLKGFGERVILRQGNFRDIDEIVKETNFSSIDGIVFDLGLGTFQIEESGRGFSFLGDEPLKMTFNPESALTAEDVINGESLESLTKIFKEYGEERNALKIAKVIVEQRRKKRITRTKELVEIILKALHKENFKGRRHPATKVFQAIRIFVNDELNNLSIALEKSLKILNPSGRIAVVSYHSLEDRIVKNFFRENSKRGLLKIITKKPIKPTKVEILNNYRSRSAKLRVAQKI